MVATAVQLVLDAPSVKPASHPGVDSATTLEPVRRLMLAVLEGAVRDFQTYAAVSTGRGRRIFMEADAWFRGGGAGPFAFETICDAVGLDPDFIRDGLRRWHRERRPQPSPPLRILYLRERNEREWSGATGRGRATGGMRGQDRRATSRRFVDAAVIPMAAQRWSALGPREECESCGQ